MLFRKIVGILIVLVIFISSTTVLFAETDNNDEYYDIDPEDIGLPSYDLDVPNEFNTTSVLGTLMYELPNIYGETNKGAQIQTYRDSYVLDVEDGFFWDFDPINSIVNIMFEVQMNAVEIGIFVVATAVSRDFTEVLQPLLESTTKDLWNGSMKHIMMVIISLMCIFVAFQLVKADKLKAIVAVGSMVFIIALSYYYFENTGTILSKANEASGWLSSEMVISLGSDNGGKPVETKIANNMWDQYVHTPWQMMEFFSINIAEQKSAYSEEYTNEEEILNRSPESSDRQNKYEKIMRQKSLRSLGIKRIAFMIVYFVPLIVSLGVILILSLMSIGYQFYLLVVIFMGIFVLPIAFHPDVGFSILRIWGLKIAGAAGMKILLVFLINIFLAVNETMFKSATDEGLGWFTVLLLQLVLYVVIFVKRKDIFNIFGVASSAIQNSNMMMGKFRNLSMPSKEKILSDAKDTRATVMNYSRRAGKVANFGKGMYNATANNHKRTAKLNSEYDSDREAYKEKKGDDMNMDSYIWKMKGLNREKYSDKDIEPHKDKAEKYLSNKYNREMKRADKKVDGTDFAPEYNKFIRTANLKKYRGDKKMFTDEQINDVAKRYEKVERYKRIKKATINGRKLNKERINKSERDDNNEQK